MARLVHFRSTDLKGSFTQDSTTFDPSAFLDSEVSNSGLSAAQPFLEQNDFRKAIISAFQLPSDDAYVYHAVASVTLEQVQSAIDAGSANGLHQWYHYSSSSQKPRDAPPPPSTSDIQAYTAIFDPGTPALSALSSFAANGKKDSLRKEIGHYLLDKRYVHPSYPDPKKRKKPPATYPANPALDFWSWSCRNLEWAGPTADTAKTKIAHHVLPVMMHHFGCVAPTEESFHMLSHAATGSTAKKAILEIGSGNGYWTLMLRQRRFNVTPVDNQQSLYRTCWIENTVREDGVRWLKRNNGAKDMLLLLVYPITAGNWTAEVLRAYKGDTICIAGTQNDNRYTAFKDETVESWMSREKREFVKMVQIPLPSFAGKDEALYIYQRKDV